MKSGRILFSTPDFVKNEKNPVAKLIYPIVWAVTLSISVVGIVLSVLAPDFIKNWLALVFSTIAINLVLVALVRRGYVRLAAVMLSVQSWAIITVLSWTTNGLGSRAAWGYFLVVFIAGMLLGRWSGIAAAVSCSLSTLVLAVASPIRSPDPVKFWLINSMYLLLVLMLQNLASRSIRESLQQAQRELLERQQAEVELRGRENMLSSIFRAAPVGIGVVRERVLTMVNSRVCEMTGWTQEELLGESSRFLYPSDDDFNYVGTEKYRQIAERGTGTVETRWQRKDGQIIDVLLSSTPINPLDLSAGVTFTALDITNRMQAEKKLFFNSQRTQVLLQFGQMTEAPLQQITDFALEKAVELTQSKIGYVAFLNEDESIMTMHSWSKSAMAECTIVDKPIVYPVSSTGLWGEAVRQRRPIISNDYPASPWKKGFPQGHVALTRHMNVPVFQGSRIVLVAGVGNKTEEYIPEDAQQLTLIMEGMWRLIERKLAEEKLVESERRYRALFESAGDAILLLQGNRIIDCNARTLEVFGCEREQILGLPISRFHPPRQPDGGDSLVNGKEKNAAALGGDSQFFEWRHVRFDGAPFDAEVNLNRVELGSGMHLLAIVRDITRHKVLEEQLRQAQKMEAIGILAGGVAHDFNNILSTIVGYASLLQMLPDLDHKAKEYLERILTSTERASSLTHSLLTFSRKQAIELQPVEINEAIFGFHKILARLIGEDIDFTLNLASENLVVDADVRQLEQVLMNLVTNARDAMPRNGKLTIATRFLLRTEDTAKVPAGSYAVISVADSGEGMSDETQKHLFEPFYTTKEAGKGTGLGLAIAYGIIKNHQGYIEVESRAAQGSTFHIYLPLKTQALRKGRRMKQPKIPRGTETILLVEDDAAVRQVTKAMLEEFGYMVLEAADGLEALSVFAENQQQIGLLLCDMVMPKKNGRETRAGIMKIKPGIKTIFMSGYTNDIIARKNIQEPGVHLLLKPLHPTTLLEKIRQVLDQ